MFSVFKKKNSDYSKIERVFTALLSFVVFGIVGGVVRLFSDTVSLGENSIAAQFLPFVLGFGIIAAIMGYFFPKVMNIVMCFIPIPGAGN